MSEEQATYKVDKPAGYQESTIKFGSSDLNTLLANNISYLPSEVVEALRSGNQLNGRVEITTHCYVVDQWRGACCRWGGD